MSNYYYKDFYSNLQAQLNAPHLAAVFAILAQHVGKRNAIGIDDIALAVFGDSRSSSTRRVRLILAELVTQFLVPVCGTSQTEGRWLAETQADIDATVADLESRTLAVTERIQALRRVRLPAAVPGFTAAEQPSLWGRP